MISFDFEYKGFSFQLYSSDEDIFYIVEIESDDSICYFKNRFKYLSSAFRYISKMLVYIDESE